MYLNKTKVCDGELLYEGDFDIENGKFSMGNTEDGFKPFDGQIDELRIYTKIIDINEELKNIVDYKCMYKCKECDIE